MKQQPQSARPPTWISKRQSGCGCEGQQGCALAANTHVRARKPEGGLRPHPSAVAPLARRRSESGPLFIQSHPVVMGGYAIGAEVLRVGPNRALYLWHGSYLGAK